MTITALTAAYASIGMRPLLNIQKKRRVIDRERMQCIPIAAIVLADEGMAKLAEELRDEGYTEAGSILHAAVLTRGWDWFAGFMCGVAGVELPVFEKPGDFLAGWKDGNECR